MLFRMLPGLLVSFLLALAFHIASGPGDERVAVRRPRAETPTRATVFPEPEAPASRFSDAEAIAMFPASRDDCDGSRHRSPAVPTVPAAPASSALPPAPASEIRAPGDSRLTGAVVRMSPKRTPEAFAAYQGVQNALPAGQVVRTAPEDNRGAESRAVSAMAPPRRRTPEAADPARAPMTRVRDLRLGREAGAGSSRAFASLDDAGPERPAIAFRYPDMPDKGIAVYVGGSVFSERQDEREKGLSAYKFHGRTGSVGFMYDWSIDSTVGLRVDYLDAEARSRLSTQAIRNNLHGFLLNGNYEGLLLGKYPLTGNLVYGRIRAGGDGSLTDWQTGAQYSWNESKHRSNLYGGSIRAGLPLVCGDDFKVLPEIGFQYYRLRTDSHDVEVGNEVLRIGRQSATSTTVPLTVTIKRDFLQCWGLFTPRLTLGYTREFDESGWRVRTFNTSATAEIYYTPGLAQPDLDRDDGQKNIMHFGVGLDIATVGGWQVTADYVHRWAAKNRADSFTLELGRCF